MKKYTQPILEIAQLHAQAPLMAQSPGKSYNEVGDGNQLTRRQIWSDDEQ